MNWAYQVKHILDNIGLPDIWIQQDTVEINFLVIKQRIIDIYKQTWYQECVIQTDDLPM